MFSRLVASASGRSQFRRPAVIIGSIAAHAVLLAGVIWASAPEHADEAQSNAANEEVTYIDIAEIPPPPDIVFEEPPAQPPPAAPPPAAAARAEARPGPTRPAEPRRTTASPPAVTSTEPAGFQELRPPATAIGIPAPDPSAVAVRAEDFGGRGAVGGTAGGTRADTSGGARIGTGDGTGSGSGSGTAAGSGTGTGDGPPTGTFSPNLVDRRAELTNRTEVVRVLQRLYPHHLSQSGTEGSVRVQFVVSADGRVDMSTIQILASTNDEFADATRKALQEFRFRPARKGPHNVRMLTMLPIEWKLPR
jgi:TonB family protein